MTCAWCGRAYGCSLAELDMDDFAHRRLRPDLCLDCFQRAARDGSLDHDLPLLAARKRKERRP
jgi:hypothetical protein